MRIRPLAAALALAALAATVAAQAPARAATPSSGTLSSTSGPISWTGGPFVGKGDVGAGETTGCSVPLDPLCDRFTLTVEPLASPSDDVEVVVTADARGDEHEIFVYDDGEEVARAAAIGSAAIVMRDLPPGTYDVAVRATLLLAGDGSFNATARAFEAPAAEVDLEDHCPMAGLDDNPRPSVSGLTDDGRQVAIDVHVLGDGITEQQAAEVFSAASRPYEALGLSLRMAGYEAFPVGTDDALAIVALAKDRFGGARPDGVDIVLVATGKDIQQVGEQGVAGMADCVGGVQWPQHAFAVAEIRDMEFGFGGISFYKDFSAKTTAHEIGHLMGSHHHYANCAQGIDPETEVFEPSPCSLMTNFADFLSLQFDTLNGAATRGHAIDFADS